MNLKRVCGNRSNSNQSWCTSPWSFDTVWSSANEHGTIGLAWLCCHDNPNYLPLLPSFYTGREPLCSLGICISLGQVLKVREMKQNKNSAEQTIACVRIGDSLQHIWNFWQAFLLLNISWTTQWNIWSQGQLKLSAVFCRNSQKAFRLAEDVFCDHVVNFALFSSPCSPNSKTLLPPTRYMFLRS